ncbi:MAG: hypothetical protein LBT98_04105 [Puniceicoccales bacterium]|nr:hypothetical protein [Puniceicoccales bacterium]
MARFFCAAGENFQPTLFPFFACPIHRRGIPGDSPGGNFFHPAGGGGLPVHRLLLQQLFGRKELSRDLPFSGKGVTGSDRLLLCAP